MTESSLLTTHLAANHYPVTTVPSLASPLPNGSLSDTNLPDEEEYTIKCICGYADDDGNTVYCPKCDTWQHIECYYHAQQVPDEHFCADCFPRDLDAKKATERQRKVREALDGGDRKVKRPSSKSHKKKQKDIGAIAEQVNGWHHDRNESMASTRDGPPTKKPKTSHRTSDSIVSTNGISRKRAVSNLQSYPSPSKSPQDIFRFPAIPTYTNEFLELYDRDEGDTKARDNEQTIQGTNILFSWRNNSALVAGPGQHTTSQTPFVRAETPVEPSSWPKVTVESVRKTDIDLDGRSPTWRFLRVHAPVKKNEIVGEVKGQVGMLEEYCQQKSSSNRWQELHHPDPFVFFHPHMNIYIDSRRSGTQFRYIRRSCQPNVTLKTFVSDTDETHHCFVASQDIAAGSELTTMWFLDYERFNIDQTEAAQNQRFDWVSRVLANFGDCTCDLGAQCLLAPFDRRYPGKAVEAPPKEKAGRKKKSKRNHIISPFSTGHATNSRAGSEPKVLDDEESERRSTPESSRSGGHSRDITPVNVAALDADPILGSGLTSRELRKIQMAEKAFAQQQQEKKDPTAGTQQRKKKRTSGGSTLNTPTANGVKQPGQHSTSQPNTPMFLADRFHETSMGSPPPPRGATSRGKSTEASSKPQVKASKPVYIDVAIQTDPEEEETPGLPPAKRRRYCTPTQRLLRKLQEDRAKYGRPTLSGTTPSSESPAKVAQKKDDDVEMTGNAAASPKPGTTNSSSPLNVGATTYPLPSQAAHTHQAFRPPAAPKLHLSTLPPVPTFPQQTTSASSSSASATTPGMATSATTQSPTPIASISMPYTPLTAPVVTPSPARKKLSLGDYMIRRAASTPTIERSQSQVGFDGTDADSTKTSPDVANTSTKPGGSVTPEKHPDEQFAQQVTTQGRLSGSAGDDTEMKDDGEEPEYSPPDVVPMDIAAESLPPVKELNTVQPPDRPPAMSAEVMNVVAQLAQFQRRN